jgi:hypothetical protein
VFKIFEEKASRYGFKMEDRYSLKERVILSLRVSKELTLFVLLVIDDIEEGFAIRLATSPDGEFPFYEISLDGKSYNGRCHVPLDVVAGMAPKNGMTHFWQIGKPVSLGKMMRRIEKGIPLKDPDVPDENIVVAVDDALKMFQDFGVPFFEKIAAEQNLRIDWKRDAN